MEKAIKQRLLGGLVLVAGAILFLPMLLDGSGAALTVPPMPAPPVVAGVDEISPNLEAAVAEAEKSVATAHAEVLESDEAASVEEDVKPDTAAIAPVSVPVAAPAPSVAQNEANRLADEKAAQAKAAAAKAAAETAAQEKLVRERAVQEAKAKAEQEKAKVAAAAASKPEVKPAVAETALPAAWVVQVASLSTRDKADDLAQRLRQKSYRAVVQQQGGAWRVLVGPELRREVAESVKARLAADPEFKLDGWLQAYKP